MAEEKKNLPAEEAVTEEVAVVETTETVAEGTTEPVADAPAKTGKKVKEEKKENFFVRLWKRIKKLCKDTYHEMKKVRWTPKNELVKSSVLVVVAVCITAVALALVDSGFSWLINTIAGLIG